MKLKVEEIPTKNYSLIANLKHDDLLPFLNEKSNSKKQFIYYIFICVLFFSLSLFTYNITKSFLSGNLGFSSIILHIVLGIVLLILFIPIHELLHALAYKIVGAPKVSFVSQLRKLYFATVADLFVINTKEFRFVATLPFLTALVCVLISTPFCNEAWRITLFTFFLLHNLTCLGDFILLNFMEINKKDKIITYDDNANKMSYFYKKG